jgi:hypothetical protein
MSSYLGKKEEGRIKEYITYISNGVTDVKDERREKCEVSGYTQHKPPGHVMLLVLRCTCVTFQHGCTGARGYQHTCNP